MGFLHRHSNTAVFFVGINQMMLKHQNDRFLVVFYAFVTVLSMDENDLDIRQWQAYKDTDAIRKIKKKPKEIPWAKRDIEEKFDMSYHRQSYCSLIYFLPEKRG